MRKTTPIVAMMIVALFLISVAATSANATVVTVNKPVVKQGDSWAMGKEIDLHQNLSAPVSSLVDLMTLATGMTVDKMDIHGNASAWLIYTVKSVDGNKISGTVRMAMKVTTGVQFQVSGEMPVEGKYLTLSNPWGAYSNADKESKTISGDLTGSFAIVAEGNAIMDNGTWAIDSLQYQLSTSAKVSFVGTNIPNIVTNGSYTEISYKNYDANLRLDANLAVNVTFVPSLQVLQFPLSVGKQWTSVSNATVSGSIGGFIDSNGLSDDITKAIFQNDLVNQTGATSFPISFDHLNSKDGKIVDGKLRSVSTPVSTTFKVVSVVNMTVAGYGPRDVYKISVNNGASYFYYSPDTRGVVGQTASVDSLESVTSTTTATDISSSLSGLDPYSSTIPTMDLVSVDPGTATSHINEIADFQGSISNDVNGADSINNIGDFFIKSPYTGFVMVIVAIAIIGVAMVLVLRKK